jgi:hypothetical protein
LSFTYLVKALYVNTTSSILSKVVTTKRVNINIGVQQGSIISPLLYDIFMDDFISSLDLEKDDLSLLYADDIIISSHSKTSLNRVLENAYLHSKVNLYNFSVMKSLASHEGIELNKTPLPLFDNTPYLGVIINKKGINVEKQTSISIAKAKAATLKLQKVLKEVNLDSHYIQKAYKTFIRPILEYALVVIPTNNTILHKLDLCQSWSLKVLFKTKKSFNYKLLHLSLALPNFAERTAILRFKYCKNISQDFLINSLQENCKVNYSSSQTIKFDAFLNSFQEKYEKALDEKSTISLKRLSTIFYLSEGIAKSFSLLQKMKVDIPLNWEINYKLLYLVI